MGRDKRGDRGKGQKLTREDGMLWKRVANTTTPLNTDRGKNLAKDMERLMRESSVPKSAISDPQEPVLSDTVSPISASRSQPSFTSGTLHESHPIEQRTLRRLARGRQNVDARIDLHGMTQDRARFALLDFLQMAQRADYRIVLVITGKGDRGQGVLRRNVPEWLKLPPFTACVNGVTSAAPGHGGEGALYVRIRRRRP